MTRQVLRLGTRGSRLALAQAALAARALRVAVAGLEVEIVPVTTRGDELSERRPHGGFLATDGQFTSDLEQRLLAGEIDAAVHSLKDLPTASDPRLGIAAVLARDDPRDCLITAADLPWQALPAGARIGTSSPRRAAQLAGMRPDFVAEPIRGNVETRLARVARHEYDGALLAAAGLDRLEIAVPQHARLSLELMLPAPGQGAVAIQAVRGSAAFEAMAIADHRPTRIAVEAERQLLRAIGGGCLAPLGALGVVEDGELRVSAAYQDRDGRLQRAAAEGPVDQVEAVIGRVAVLLSRAATPLAGSSAQGAR